MNERTKRTVLIIFGIALLIGLFYLISIGKKLLSGEKSPQSSPLPAIQLLEIPPALASQYGGLLASSQVRFPPVIGFFFLDSSYVDNNFMPFLTSGNEQADVRGIEYGNGVRGVSILITRQQKPEDVFKKYRSEILGWTHLSGGNTSGVGVFDFEDRSFLVRVTVFSSDTKTTTVHIQAAKRIIEPL